MKLDCGSDAAEMVTELAKLADLIGEDRGPDATTLFIRLDRTDRPGTCQLAVHEVDAHPTEALRGFAVPAETECLGVVAHGWAAPMPDPGGSAIPPTRPSRHPDRVRVRVTTVVARSGEVAGIVRGSDGMTITEPPAEGEVLDALRRAFTS